VSSLLLFSSPVAWDSEAFLKAISTSRRSMVSPIALEAVSVVQDGGTVTPYLASFSALLFTSWSPESSFLYTGFTPSKPSAGKVSLEGHEDISRFTRPIVSIVLGLE